MLVGNIYYDGSLPLFCGRYSCTPLDLYPPGPSNAQGLNIVFIFFFF